MITLDNPPRLQPFEYGHRHWFVQDGAYRSCTYCGATRPRSHVERGLRLVFAGLVVVAVAIAVGQGWR